MVKNLLPACSTLYGPWYRGAKGGTTPPRLTNTYSAFISFSGTEAAASAYEALVPGCARPWMAVGLPPVILWD
jgi:hypothetical protein